MKRILTLLCLALAFVSCKKEEKERNLNESDILGVWFCTEWHSDFIPVDPHMSIVVTPDHKLGLHFKNDAVHTYTWSFNGGQLAVSGDPDEIEALEVIVNELEGKHMKWTFVYPGNREEAKCAFINLSRTLPGEWAFDSEGMGHYDISIDKSGTSIWTREEQTPMEVNWEMDFDDKAPVPYIRVQGVNVDLADKFTVTSVADNRIELLSEGDVTVVLQRK